MITEWHLLNTGYCTASERIAYGTGDRRSVPCHATCALLRHADRGWLLFDTGYAPRVLTATERFPYSLYRLATPLHIAPEQSAANQLTKFGLTAKDIGAVIVSHFHADHVGGLLDFPDARLVASRTGFEAVAHRTGFDAVRRAFLPQLMPPDFVERAIWTESLPEGEPLSDSFPTRDLFGDGSCRIVALPGHANGQIGLLARTPTEELLFVADATYSARAIRENIPFHRVTRFFTDDTNAARETLHHLHQFHETHPDTLLLPTHCPEVHARCVR